MRTGPHFLLFLALVPLGGCSDPSPGDDAAPDDDDVTDDDGDDDDDVTDDDDVADDDDNAADPCAAPWRFDLGWFDGPDTDWEDDSTATLEFSSVSTGLDLLTATVELADTRSLPAGAEFVHHSLFVQVVGTTIDPEFGDETHEPRSAFHALGSTVGDWEAAAFQLEIPWDGAVCDGDYIDFAHVWMRAWTDASGDLQFTWSRSIDGTPFSDAEGVVSLRSYAPFTEDERFAMTVGRWPESGWLQFEPVRWWEADL